MECFGHYGLRAVYRCTRDEYVSLLLRGKKSDAYYVIMDDGYKFVIDNTVVGMVDIANRVISTKAAIYIQEMELMEKLCGKCNLEEKMGQVEDSVLDRMLGDAAASLTIGGLDLDKVLTEYAVDV